MEDYFDRTSKSSNIYLLYMKKKKSKPNYQTDKYGLLYDTNKQLSENDREILKTLQKMVKNRTGTDDKQ